MNVSTCPASIDECQMQINDFSDVSMCNIVVCDKMREACGSSINVEIPMDIDSVLMDTIIESEFELWAPCLSRTTPYATSLWEWTARPLSKRLKMRLHVGIAATKTPNVPLRFTMVSRAGIRLWMSRFPT
jgi:hypothetical protein